VACFDTDVQVRIAKELRARPNWDAAGDTLECTASRRSWWRRRHVVAGR